MLAEGAQVACRGYCYSLIILAIKINGLKNIEQGN